MTLMKRLSLVAGMVAVAALAISGCNPFGSDSEGGTTTTLTHFGFDFSEGEAITDNYDDNDGEVISWQPGGATNEQYPSGQNLWWRNDQVTSGTPNETRDMGSVSLSSVGSAPTGWDESPTIPPLLVGHVYVAKCREGYVKFEVVSLDVENWEATVKYVYSSSSSF